jgi:hypothetical protein
LFVVHNFHHTNRISHTVLRWARPRQYFCRSGQNARNCCHSSPPSTASIGPSALDRRTGAVRSSVRSHRSVGSRPDVPRRHPCRPATLLGGVCHALGAQSSRPPAPCLADRRIGRSSEASDHSGRAVQRARGGALSRASALRPPAAAFLTAVRATRRRLVRAVLGAWSRLLPDQSHPHRSRKAHLA